MIDLLKLLESLESGHDRDGDIICPSCEADISYFKRKIDHFSGCELIAAIDALASGRLAVVDREYVRQAVMEITGVSMDNLLNEAQKQVFIEAIIKGQLANPPVRKGKEG